MKGALLKKLLHILSPCSTVVIMDSCISFSSCIPVEIVIRHGGWYFTSMGSVMVWLRWLTIWLTCSSYRFIAVGFPCCWIYVWFIGLRSVLFVSCWSFWSHIGPVGLRFILLVSYLSCCYLTFILLVSSLSYWSYLTFFVLDSRPSHRTVVLLVSRLTY